MSYTLVDVSSVLEVPIASIFRVPWAAESSKTLVNTYQISSIVAHKAAVFIVTMRS
jgi:hypothetical protein